MNPIGQSNRPAAGVDRRTLLRHSAFAIPAAALAVRGLPTARAANALGVPPPSAPPPDESGYASVNGLEMYYEVRGSGDPVILLHGGLTTIDLQFGALLGPLSADRQVIGAELQAHGHTADIDRPMSFEAMADDVAGLIEHLGLERVDIFGYSLGGGVAMQTAIRHPELVRKLVVASTVIRLDGWYPEVLAGMQQMKPESAEAMQGLPFYEAYVQVAPRPEDWPTLIGKVGQLTTTEYDWTADLETITAPTLLVMGDSDSVRPEHAVEIFRLLGGGVPGDFGALPASQLDVLPGTAHSTVTYRVDLLMATVPAFLDTPMPAP